MNKNTRVETAEAMLEGIRWMIDSLTHPHPIPPSAKDVKEVAAAVESMARAYSIL